VADPKHDETFRVIDRRLFNEEGELRKDIPEQDRRIEEAPVRKPDQGAQTIITGPPERTSTDAGSEAAATPAAALGNTETGTLEQGSRSFQMLVDFLTRNAAAMLGGMPDPRTGQAYLDLEGAREMIDMLDALREKTKGNLAKVDDDLLVEVIGSLKLTFMEISKAAAEQMKKKAQGKV
jgi:Domain of unknown function (DUF1844)